VTDAPETRYARAADGTNLAYQVSGNGPLPLVTLGGLIPNDLRLDDPAYIRLSKRLGTFTRTVRFEARGWGASEGDPQDAAVEAIFDGDLISVLNALGFERAALLAGGPGGAAGVRFSVRHPERVSALMLFNCFAHYVQEDDYPCGIQRDRLDEIMAAIEQRWGTAATVELLAPGQVTDERYRAWLARSARLGGGPRQMAESIRAWLEDDVRPLLSSISVPTLVMHREGNQVISLDAGRYLAEHIPGATFVVLPGSEHMMFLGDTDAVADEIEDFLTGTRSGAEASVVMAAVLFTDIVASTEHQARVGPREWSRLTDHHDALVRAALARHRGREVKTTGDGFLATFDTTGTALRCAAQSLAQARGIGMELRAGVHLGEVEQRGDDIAGLAVNIAKRVCDLAGPGEVFVSETVRAVMVGSAIEFEDRGEHELKGVPGRWRLYSVVS
jgi:class 3 adenylate cyclase